MFPEQAAGTAVPAAALSLQRRAPGMVIVAGESRRPGTAVPGRRIAALPAWLPDETEVGLCCLAGHLDLRLPAAVREQAGLGQGQGQRGVSSRVAELEERL